MPLWLGRHSPDTIPKDTNGNPLPPPCPPECVNTLPVDMWGAYWAYSEKGRLPLPASVPYRLSRFDKRWSDAVRKWKNDHGSLPKVWKAYWGKFMTDLKQPGGGFEEVNVLPDEFWLEYLQNHPDGHWEDDTECIAPPWSGDRVEDRTGYYLIRGSLYYRHQNGMTYAATGVDSFPPI